MPLPKAGMPFRFYARTIPAAQANPGCLFLFDLMEGVASVFEGDGVTYIRHYTRPKVSELLADAGLALVAFDEVRHDAEHTRLLVVARN